MRLPSITCSILAACSTLTSAQNIDTSADFKALKQSLVEDYKKIHQPELPKKAVSVEAFLKQKKSKLKPSMLKLGEFQMPYVLLERGNDTFGEKSLYIALHGGGGNGSVKGPHAWGVNSREWNTQINFTIKGVYSPNGIYFIPRMADDRLGRWQHDHNQIAFEKVIREAILLHGVNPNKVYMIGISEGGYAAFRFAANRSDWFAGTGSMAAAEPFNTSPPENFRNLAFRNDIGENDKRFDRIGLARKFDAKLTELGKADSGHYIHFFNPQKGRGHGINYRACPTWVAQHTRNPSPHKVVWTVQKMHTTLKKQNYWLAVDQFPTEAPLFLTAEIKNNSISVSALVKNEKGERVPAKNCKLRVYLDDKLIDFDKAVSLSCNGKVISKQKAKRSVDVAKKSYAERGDKNFTYSSELTISL